MLELLENEFIIRSVVAGSIVIAGFIAAHFLSKSVGLFFKKTGLGEKIKAKGWPKPEIILENGIKYVVYILAVIFALKRLEIFDKVFHIFIIALAITVLIFLFLNFNDIILNFFAKLLYFKKNLKVGKKIKIDGISGRILKIGLTEIKILTDKGNIMILPNAYVSKKKYKITNN